METVSTVGHQNENASSQYVGESSHRYDPGGERLLNLLMEKLGITTDRALSRTLDVDTATLSRIRNRRTPVPAAMIVKMLEITDLSVHEIKAVLRAHP
ncbi:helix-turn-helix domain-containing protein [Noviherbaspirillum galbum]|uniref:Bacteriophage CI repressor N-terminal domain-containing protein n=1 Tax=Noviherbaspirillum galbum TaxID=2709383 RepID=A0A6B3SHJ4_9BURK|nr:helix-turn-helix domain-containing protein [Noviherbaspirillum galbum]NEX60138.1 hypothetical protein [Noviherbaspirillum galbum]